MISPAQSPVIEGEMECQRDLEKITASASSFKVCTGAQFIELPTHFYVSGSGILVGHLTTTRFSTFQLCCESLFLGTAPIYSKRHLLQADAPEVGKPYLSSETYQLVPAKICVSQNFNS